MLAREAISLGITKEELLDYLEKEESSDEHTDPHVQESL